MSKTYIFTVTNHENDPTPFTVMDHENYRKPIEWTQMASDYHCKNQSGAEALLIEWATNNLELDDFKPFKEQLTNLAEDMRKYGYVWFQEKYCFELSEVNG